MAEQRRIWSQSLVPRSPPHAHATLAQMRAMNKSYAESGGTVLSTNWDEIGKEKTPVKPPEGMEFKKWN